MEQFDSAKAGSGRSAEALQKRPFGEQQAEIGSKAGHAHSSFRVSRRPSTVGVNRLGDREPYPEIGIMPIILPTISVGHFVVYPSDPVWFAQTIRKPCATDTEQTRTGRGKPWDAACHERAAIASGNL
jgi:hypothetical protein